MFAKLRHAGSILRRRPRTVGLVLALLVLLGAVGISYAYAFRQWDIAQRALEENRPADAEKPLGVCLRLWPRNPAVLLLAARAARLNGHFEAAETYLNRCLKLRPATREAVQLEFLLMRVQGGEVDEVEEPLLNCVENGHPESALILETLAGAYMRNLRYAPALNALNRWIEVAPGSVLAHQHRGWLLERANDPQAALADYRRAVELAPDLIAPRLRLAELLLQENEPAEAVPHLERLHRQYPGRADVTARLGQCRFHQGRTEEARRLLEAAVEKLPDDPLVLIHLAKLDSQEGRPVKAEQWLRRLLSVDAADAEGQYNLIQVLRQQGRREEAEAAKARYHDTQELLKRVNILLRDEVERAPNNPSAPSEAGRGLLRLGQDRLGLHWLHEALRRDPKHRPTHQALAEYYEKKKDPEQAAFHRHQLAGPSPSPALP